MKECNIISILSNDVPIPNTDAKPEKVARAIYIGTQIKQVKDDEKKLKQQIKSLDIQITQTQKDIDAIPSCTVCGRPTIQYHEHT